MKTFNLDQVNTLVRENYKGKAHHFVNENGIMWGVSKAEYKQVLSGLANSSHSDKFRVFTGTQNRIGYVRITCLPANLRPAQPDIIKP